MKITLWGINYAPESIGIAPFNRELCDFLASRGHQVTAVCSFSYYPHWRKAPEDRVWHRAETMGKVRVHRCWCYVPVVVTTLRRVFHELSFGISSLFRVLLLPRADVYVVVSPPLGLGFFAWLACLLKRSRFVFHVQDLQPDAAIGLGMIKPGVMVRILRGLERFAYAKATVVSGISEGMITAFRAKKVPGAKRMLLPNWLRSELVVQRDRRSRELARLRFGIPDDAFLAVYSGNLGRKQSLEILVEAASLLPVTKGSGPRNVQLIIAGNGAMRPALEESLKNNPELPVQLLPLLSDDDYRSLLTAADVALITQAAGSGQFFFPSKLLSVLVAGLPVIAVADADSELARAVKEGGFGAAVPPGDAAALASLMSTVSNDPVRLASWAERTVWAQQFSAEEILPRFESLLISIVPGARAMPSEAPQALGVTR